MIRINEIDEKVKIIIHLHISEPGVVYACVHDCRRSIGLYMALKTTTTINDSI